MLVLIWAGPAYGFDGIEKVNIYVGHFLLQSWPLEKRTITMEIDTAFPPDTLVFQALASNGGLKNTTLEIRDTKGIFIEEVSRVTRLEDETEATFIYVLTAENVRKMKDHRFAVILNSHLDSDPEVHSVALILLDCKR